MIAYPVVGIFLAVGALFAHPVIVSAIYPGCHVLVEFLFVPLLAGRAIRVGIAALLRFDLLAGPSWLRRPTESGRGGQTWMADANPWCKKKRI